MPAAMYIYRRHLGTCPHRRKGVEHRRCGCPIWLAGLLNGRPIRRALHTADWPEASRRMVRVESGKEIVPRSLDEAVEAWAAALEVEPSTRVKYLRTARQLAAFARSLGIKMVAELTVAALDRFRAARPVARTTSIRELQQLRQFLGFCVERGWREDNPARAIKAPANAKPRPVEPYTGEQMAAILDACGRIGLDWTSGYERARARALILLMRHAGLRIGDAVMLSRDAVRDGEILLRTKKTGTAVRLPLPAEVLAALDSLPLPRTYDGKGRQTGYFFWNGVSTPKGLVNMAERTLAAVFRKSGVPSAHAHRFRHTLAIEVLTRGGTIEDVARILGNTPAVAYRHYAPWCASYQQRITKLMHAVHAGGRKPAGKVAGEAEAKQRRVM